MEIGLFENFYKCRGRHRSRFRVCMGNGKIEKFLCPLARGDGDRPPHMAEGTLPGSKLGT